MVAGAALLAIPIFAAHDLYALGNMGCEVRPEVLVIRWGLYRREIPLKEIESVEKVKLKGEYRPVLRTFGIGEPGYKVGWFKLAGGGKALLFVGNVEEVVCLRAEGSTVVLGVCDPERFLDHIECVPLMKLGQQERVVLIQVQSSRLVGSRLIGGLKTKNHELRTTKPRTIQLLTSLHCISGSLP